jgi:hypothetical protein
VVLEVLEDLLVFYVKPFILVVVAVDWAAKQVLDIMERPEVLVEGELVVILEQVLDNLEQMAQAVEVEHGGIVA